MDSRQKRLWRNPVKIMESCNSKGYTLLEIILVLALLSLLISISFPDLFAMRQRTLLQTTASELSGAVMLARQLSGDEGREYVVEMTSLRMLVRPNRFGSKAVLSLPYPEGLKRGDGSTERVTFNRKGQSHYGKFILENGRKQQIHVEVHIGTGRVTVSDIL